jgi:hypothetical protein
MKIECDTIAPVLLPWYSFLSGCECTKSHLVLCPYRAQRINNTEGLQPNPLVDMTVEEHEAFCHELTDIAKNLGVLILLELFNALDITNEINGLQEAVEAHCLNQQLFSAHARIDGTVVMVTMMDICLVSQNVFGLINLSSQLTIMHYHYNRIF